MFAACSAASGRGAKTAAWLAECHFPGSKPSDFEEVSRKWRSFDAKLQKALRDIITGDLARRVGVAMDIRLAKGQLLSGRATLSMLYGDFEPDGRSHSSDAISDIYGLKCKRTMVGLEGYLSTLDGLFLRCRGEHPSPGILACRFYSRSRALPASKGT